MENNEVEMVPTAVEFKDWPSEPSALWIAAAANLVETAKFLLEDTPFLRHPDSTQTRALQPASYYGHLEMFQLLLEHGADVNARGEPYGSALQAAVYMGNTNVVRLLLENGADAVKPYGRYGPVLIAVVY